MTPAEYADATTPELIAAFKNGDAEEDGPIHQELRRRAFPNRDTYERDPLVQRHGMGGPVDDIEVDGRCPKCYGKGFRYLPSGNTIPCNACSPEMEEQ